MKKIMTLAMFIAVTFASYSQSLGYQDLGVLFSRNDQNGTARFSAMAGSFGAIGGDISSININPAGLAVFKDSEFTGSLNSRNTTIGANYYETLINSQNFHASIPQIGAVFVFDMYDNSEWSKVAIGFNYRVKKDFDNQFLARGNNGFTTFNSYPLDQNETPIQYNIANEQVFDTTFRGKISEMSFGLSAIHQEKLYVGLALNTYDLQFTQIASLYEYNNDEQGNTLDASLYQENITAGSGISLNTGFIYKILPSFRFGLSYQTPTWFSEVVEETNITENDGYFGDAEISVSNDTELTYANTAGNYFPTQSYLYQLRTPGKFTASSAIIFGKSGLVNVDYTRKNYRNIRLSNADFSVENQYFQNNLRNTTAVNIGTEWRFGNASVRGGYQFEQSPYDIQEVNDLKKYSFGGGYHFGKFKIDFSYSDFVTTGSYNFYAQFEGINAASLTTNTSVFTTTLTLKL